MTMPVAGEGRPAPPPGLLRSKPGIKLRPTIRVTPDTSVIIPCYVPDKICRKHMFECLDRLWEFTDPDAYEPVIIDNGSKFCRDEMIHVADVYEYYPEPLGYAKAINLGITAAHGHYLVLMHNDTFVRAGWLEAFIQEHIRTGEHMIGTVKFHWSVLCFTTRYLMDTVGPFNEDLPYHETVDEFEGRVKHHGYDILPLEMKVYHASQGTWDSLR